MTMRTTHHRAVAALLLLIALWLPTTLPAAERGDDAAASAEPDPAADPRLKDESWPSQGRAVIGGRTLEYRAVAGLMPIDDSKEEASATISYVAYFGAAAPGAPRRPVVFLYNGGPGSASLWLHLGAFGPTRVLTANGRFGPAAPYRLVDNEHSLLDVADLVFVDAPGTGFGRIVAVDRSKAKEREKLKDKEKEFWGVDQDAKAFARFIQKFLARHQLWNAPKYLFGESYGTTRSAVLARLLHEDHGIDVNGVLLLSQILNFALSADEPQFNPGVDLPYALALPTFAATAWYHDRLPAWRDRSPQTLEALLAEARRFAIEEYALALQAGNRLDAAGRRAIAEKMSALVGLPVDYLERANLRINGGTFGQQLLADRGLVLGRFDTRYSGPTHDPLAKEWRNDPSSAAIVSNYVSAWNDYARRVLGVPADKPYRPWVDVFETWDWRHKAPGADGASGGNLNVMTDLAALMTSRPTLRVATFSGLYDLATLFFAAEYELDHLPIPPALRANLEIHHYPAGHMMYDDPASLRRLHDDVARFLRETGSAAAQ